MFDVYENLSLCRGALNILLHSYSCSSGVPRGLECRWFGVGRVQALDFGVRARVPYVLFLVPVMEILF